MTFTQTMAHVAQGVEAAGVAVLVGGLIWSALHAERTWARSRDSRATYAALRHALGSVLLLGLEILVVADLIRTVTVAQTVTNVVALAVIVLIRTFLSFSLEIEIDGELPWRRSPRGSG